MYAVPRKRFDVDSLLSPSFAKIFEESGADTKPIAWPADIFRIDVNDFLADFAATSAGCLPLKPISENNSGTKGYRTVLGSKENTLQAALATADAKRRSAAAVPSRFGFTKH
jgi:hypothetical protein